VLEEELKEYVHSHTLPSMVDVEMAKRIILEELNSSSFSDRGVATSDVLIARVNANLNREKGPTPEGYMQIAPDLNIVKWNIAAREAIQILHATGVIIAIGSPVYSNEKQSFNVSTLHNLGTPAGEAYYPSVAIQYRLAAAFREDQSIRLASGDTFTYKTVFERKC
jgi:hypothetical protein